MEGRHQLHEGKKIRVALLEPMITVFTEEARVQSWPEEAGPGDDGRSL
jgi:hypothetical protein